MRLDQENSKDIIEFWLRIDRCPTPPNSGVLDGVITMSSLPAPSIVKRCQIWLRPPSNFVALSQARLIRDAMANELTLVRVHFNFKESFDDDNPLNVYMVHLLQEESEMCVEHYYPEDAYDLYGDPAWFAHRLPSARRGRRRSSRGRAGRRLPGRSRRSVGPSSWSASSNTTAGNVRIASGR